MNHPRVFSKILVVFLLFNVLVGLTDAQSDKTSLLEQLRDIAAPSDLPYLFRFDPPFDTTTKEPIFHQPEAIGVEIERQIDRLPTSGQARRTPWSGYWWPMRNDGIASSIDRDASPIAKYCEAFGVDVEAETWERKHHGTEQEPAPSSWWGHCNGLAAASVMEQRPAKSVTHNGVRFEPWDIEALLCEAYFGCRAIGVDRRYDGEDLIELDEFGRAADPSFRDVNPATMHLLLTNVIGVEGEAIIADFSAGSEVWNFPIAAFEVIEITELKDGADAVAQITGAPFAGPYPFHAEATRFFLVVTQVTQVRMQRGPTGTDSPREILEYQYLLETDDDGQILGGEWVGDSRMTHPDFVWRPTSASAGVTLTPDGRRVDTSGGNSNPYVLYEEVALLAQLSRRETDDAIPPSLPPTTELRVGPDRWDYSLSDAAPSDVRRFQRADVLLQQGELAEAAQLLNAETDTRATSDTGSDLESDLTMRAELRLRRGWARFLNGDVEGAIDDYRQLDRVALLAPTVKARRSIVFTASGDPVRGLIEAAQAISSNPENPWGYAARGWVYIARQAEHDCERAVADFLHAEQLAPDPFFNASQRLAEMLLEAESVEEEQIDESNAESTDEVVDVNSSPLLPREVVAPDLPAVQSRAAALVIGIDQYPSAARFGGAAGAIRFADLLRARGVVDVTLLTDADATRAAILTQFDRLAKSATPQTELHLYFAGCGVALVDRDGDEPDGLDEAWLAADLQPISDDEIQLRLRDSHASHVFVWCDAGYTTRAWSPEDGRSIRIDRTRALDDAEWSAARDALDLDPVESTDDPARYAGPRQLATNRRLGRASERYGLDLPNHSSGCFAGGDLEVVTGGTSTDTPSSFSLALVDALSAPAPNPSLDWLWSTIRQRMRTDVHHPALMGDRSSWPRVFAPGSSR